MNFQEQSALFERMKSRPGVRGKINAMCLSCIYDSATPGTWRQQTEGCTVKSCALYEIRPRSKAATVEAPEDDE